VIERVCERVRASERVSGNATYDGAREPVVLSIKLVEIVQRAESGRNGAIELVEREVEQREGLQVAEPARQRSCA